METQVRVRISRRATDRLRSGHLWVYRTELVETSGEAAPAVEAGALVLVEDSAGRPLGTALYSSSSQIALRLVSHAPVTREQYLEDVRERVAQAIARRQTVAPLSAESGNETNAQRLIFSEADGLPGIVADRYADLIIVQLLTQGTARDDMRAAISATLASELAPNGEPLTIWERSDPRIRELEQLAAPPEGPLFTNFSSTADARPDTEFLLNGLRFRFDAAAGQKTGAFLDQRLNYVAAAEWVRRSGRTGHALDVCTYQGGFALHLARVCGRITGVDQSRAALETAERNLMLNSRNLMLNSQSSSRIDSPIKAEVDWIEADAFELLRAFDEATRESGPAASASSTRKRKPATLPSGLPGQFDAIVLDPPAFAKSKRAAEGALRGYKELNLRAIRLLTPGGTLITCSCSHHISLQEFSRVVSEAAADAGRRVQLLETRAAAPDHPEVLTLPETRYLKCLICRVE